MSLTTELNGQEIRDLIPEPGIAWRRLLKFVGLTDDDKLAMSRTVEALMRCAPDMVVDTYDYLQSVPETASILGWEHDFDESHLEVRRRFFHSVARSRFGNGYQRRIRLFPVPRREIPRGACHLRAYTPAAELNVMPFGSLSVDPLHWEGKGELAKVFQDIHAFWDSLDLCKFSAFAMGMACNLYTR